MALTVKDITTFKGGVSNAIDPTDVTGDEAGHFEIVNVDGTSKPGVLRPSGTMVEYGTNKNSIDIGGLVGTAVGGKGFDIMSSDYDLGETVIFDADTDSTDFNTTEALQGGNTFSYPDSGKTIQFNINAANTINSLSFNSGSVSALDLDDATWYSYEFNYHSTKNVTGNFAWVTLDAGVVDSSAYSFNETGVVQDRDATANGHDGRFMKGIFRSKSSAGKDFKLLFYTGETITAGTIKLKSFKIKKLAMPGAHEIELVQREDSGITYVDIYQNGGDGTTIGTPAKTLTLSPQTGMDLHYLKGSNSVRISKSNFDGADMRTKFFGFIDRTFFEGLKYNPNTLLNSGTTPMHDQDDVDRSYAMKIKEWVSESSELVAPDPNFCILPCMGDIYNFTDSSLQNQSEDNDRYWHKDLGLGLEGESASGYLLRLEYIVLKENNTTQSGNWNPADDGQDGTAVNTDEKNVKYRFYCSFVYDHDSMESELTQITKCVEQGAYINQGAYVSNGWKNFTDEISLYYLDNSGAYGASGKLEAHAGQGQKHLAWDCKLGFKPTIMLNPGSKSEWNLPKRCTGVNWYYSNSQDGHAKKYRIVQTDFRDGIKYHGGIGESYLPWKVAGGYKNRWGSQENSSYWKTWYSNTETVNGGWVTMEDPPQAEDWDSLYGMKAQDWNVVNYKSSVIIGGQAYYGHVKVDGEVHRDRVLVSIGNHGYDMIPQDNYLEVLAGDGDEIVHLLTHNQQLYVFKKNKLVVCDIGGEKSDKIAAEHLVGGILNRHQSIATNNGIFWVNRYGAFLSAGAEEAKSLIKNKIRYTPKTHGTEGDPCTWSVLETEKPVIGYHPIYNQVFILTSTLEDVEKQLWRYDMADESFWYHDGQAIGAFLDAGGYSNFALDKDNNLAIITVADPSSSTTDGIIKIWDPTPISCPILWDSGATDLGSPSSLKQFYKYSVVSANADTNVEVKSLAVSPIQSSPGSWLDLDITNSNALNTNGMMEVTHHRVKNASTGADILDPTDDDEERKVARNATLLRAQITTGSNNAPADFELNSVSIVYRDKGVKG